VLFLPILRIPIQKRENTNKSKTLSKENQKKKKFSEKRTPGYPENDQNLVEEVKKNKKIEI
jgi:hypothetical protein